MYRELCYSLRVAKVPLYHRSYNGYYGVRTYGSESNVIRIKIPALCRFVMFVFGFKCENDYSFCYRSGRYCRPKDALSNVTALLLPPCSVNLAVVLRERTAPLLALSAILGQVSPARYSSFLHSCTMQHSVGWILLKIG